MEQTTIMGCTHEDGGVMCPKAGGFCQHDQAQNCPQPQLGGVCPEAAETIKKHCLQDQINGDPVQFVTAFTHDYSVEPLPGIDGMLDWQIVNDPSVDVQVFMRADITREEALRKVGLIFLNLSSGFLDDYFEQDVIGQVLKKAERIKKNNELTL